MVQQPDAKDARPEEQRESPGEPPRDRVADPERHRERHDATGHEQPVDEEEVTPTASFVEDLNADSLDLVELIMSLEEEFGMEISDEDAEKIQKVSDAVDYVEEHQ